MTPERRDPSGRVRSSSGLAESQGREFKPAYAANPWTTSISSSSLPATASARSHGVFDSARETQTSS